MDLATTNWLASVAASTNLAVAVGDNGSIYTSADGVSWTNVPAGFGNWLTGVACDGARFVAVGESGFIATSPDGMVWKTVKSKTTKNLNWVAWQGNQFMAVGDNGLTLASADGTTWQTITTGATNLLYSATGSTNDWLVAGDSELWLKDAPSWSNQLSLALPSPAPNWTYYASAWSTNSTNAYVVCGASGMTVIGARTNGATAWRAPAQPVRSWLWQTARMPDYYLAVGNYGTILSSPDGYAWSVEYVPSSITNAVLLGVGGSTNLQLAVGTQGTLLSAEFLVSIEFPP